MGFLLKISFRNLIRQKRRNILLGIAIAAGIFLLVLANSFSQGISDILFNKIIVNVAGHIAVVFSEKSNSNKPIFRDKSFMMNAIYKALGNEALGVEESIGVFGRALGNGKADIAILVSIDTGRKLTPKEEKELEESFTLIEGKFEDLSSEKIENPVIISVEKAKYLNVKKGDVVRFRYKDINSQYQAARFTVVGVVRNNNIFMESVIFASLPNVKRLMGYRPYEIATVRITIKKPKKDAVRLANKIHDLLQPKLAFIRGALDINQERVNIVLLGLRSNDDSKIMVKRFFGIDDSYYNDYRSDLLVSSDFAKNNNLKTGDKINFIYRSKFENRDVTIPIKIGKIYSSSIKNSDNYIFLDEKKFYDIFYDNLPLPIGDVDLNKYKPIIKILSPEWVLLKRTSTTDELTTKYKEVAQKKWKATIIDVQTMYESASDILKLESALKLITIVIVMILFFIILVGVINTLRMSIRERTKEIGTMRAIGMQRNDVKDAFIVEIVMLAFFSSIAGVILAFISMKILTYIKFTTQDNPFGILLVSGHLYFMPTVYLVVSNILLILFIAGLTAYFPARRASNIPPSKALSHFE
jgi:ABC-type lipoprotein release transport system permease subunit